MKCNSFKSVFSAYLEGELDSDVMAGCRVHLEQCSDCSGLVASYRKGVEVLNQNNDLEISEDLYHRVMVQVHNPAQKKVVPLRKLRLWAPVAAAAVLTLVFTFSFFNGGNERANFYSNVAVTDSTMDLVTMQMLAELPLQEEQKTEKKRPVARLSSYIPQESTEDEVVISYGVSRHPVLVESGYNIGE